jgi:GNAT superfamily N-acetyltransferase
MMSLEIHPVDPADDAMLAGWYAAYLAGDTADRPFATPWQYAEFAAEMRHPSPTDWQQAWVAVERGEVVGAGRIEFPMTDNLNLAWIEVHVPPAHRRRGIGTALHQRLQDVAAGDSRSILASETSYPFETDGSEVPGVEWSRRQGYHVGLVSIQRRLRLEGIAPRVAELAAAAAPYHRDYTLVGWSGLAPEEHLAGLAALSATITVEAPAGDLVLEEGSSDPAAYRQREQAQVAQGRTRHTTVALDAAGEVVAHSDLIFSEHTPQLAYQWGTLVRPTDRGHRLGLAVKAANLQRLIEQAPSVTEVTTYNAAENEPMVGVNDALGFVPVELLAELQKQVPAAADPR